MDTDFDIPIIFSDAVPPGEMFMLPSDVTSAIAATEEQAQYAFDAACVAYFAPAIFGLPWFLIATELNEHAALTFRIAGGRMQGACATIAKAASEKRIGHIKNLSL